MQFLRTRGDSRRPCGAGPDPLESARRSPRNQADSRKYAATASKTARSVPDPKRLGHGPTRPLLSTGRLPYDSQRDAPPVRRTVHASRPARESPQPRSPSPRSRSPSCDLLFTGGRIVDGTGAAWFRADVCVTGDRITALRANDTSTARRRIDATGLVVAPGFIDMLGQSEYWVLRDSRVASKIMQGITTELTGEASFTSVGHQNARRLHPFAAMFDKEKVPGFDNLAGYFRVLERQPATINLGTFVSAGGVRDSVIGREDRAGHGGRAEGDGDAGRRGDGGRAPSASPRRCSTCRTASRAPTNSSRSRRSPGASAAATSPTSAPRPTRSIRAWTRSSASRARPACRPPSIT